MNFPKYAILGRYNKYEKNKILGGAKIKYTARAIINVDNAIDGNRPKELFQIKREKKFQIIS